MGEIIIFYDDFEFSDSNKKSLKTMKITFFFLHKSNVLSLRYDIILCRLLLSQKAKIVTTVS